VEQINFDKKLWWGGLFILTSLLWFCSQSPRQVTFENPSLRAQAREAEQKAWSRGKEIWLDPELGTNGFSCESCHPNGEVTFAETYPKYKHVLRTMATISITHNFAVVNENRGEPWKLGSEDANALALFVTGFANGKPIRMATAFRQGWLAKGEAAFRSTVLGTNGKSCLHCHRKGGREGGTVEDQKIPSLKGVAATYPKFNPQQKRVILLEQKINMCIEDYLAGNALALNDTNLVALTGYVTSLSEGYKIAVGPEKH